MEKYIIDSIAEKITIDDKEVLFNEIPKFRDNKISTLVGDIEITKPKISYSKEDTFNAGDTYINPDNIAYLYTGDGWVEIGELKQQTENIRSSIDCGDEHSLFLLADGTVKACGYNNRGQLGDGTTTQRITPVLVSGITNCIGISAGNSHSLFLLKDGTIKACGYNNYGQLGNGNTNTIYTPVLVSGITNCISISAGNSHSLFLLSDGTVKACGYNGYGQLGDGSGTNRTIPVLNLITNCIGISVGSDYSLFLIKDGTVKAVGYNSYGQLGDGTTTNRSTPVLVSGITKCIGISAGLYGSSLFLLKDGTVKGCGYNGYGQLGNGNTNTIYTPVLNLITNCIGINVSKYYSLFLLSDGTVKACGENGYGQLGDGTTTNRSTPVLVSGVTNCISIGTGTYHSLFLLSDGTVKSCGYNSRGQLADGTTTNRSTPVVSTINNVKQQVYPNITVFDLK